MHPSFPKLSPIALACIMVGCALPGTPNATPLALSQIPAGNGGREPSPNVILTIDDSGSMAWDLATDNSTSIVANRKITLLKNSLKATFGDGTSNSGKIADGRIRLAWQAMHNNGEASGAESLTAGNTNTIRPFQGTHRTNFNTFVDSLSADDGTPSLRMMRNVYNYARTASGIDSPWANNPGTSQSASSYLACRRMYHVFLTDGAWNSQSNSNDRVGSKGDSANTTLPDNTAYTTTAATARAYKDAYGDTVTDKASTVADWAFKSWATDLQDGTNSTASMANSVRPLIKKLGNETYATTACSAANNCAVTPEYWNPRNNPATWQHVSTYTIGFGLGAVNWPYRKTGDTSLYTSTASSDVSARITPADWDYNNASADTFGGDLPRIIQGELNWPNVFPSDTSPSSAEQDQRTVELWHAAINGRGKYYPVKTADGLTAAFEDILNTVISDTSRPLVSIATSSSYLRSGLSAYIAGYSATKYSGTLSSRPIEATSGAIQSSENWNAATQLDALTSTQIGNRVVLSYSGTAGINWSTYTSLPTAQKTKLNQNSSGTADNLGQQRVDYIRGTRTQESANGGVHRDRDSRLGDIVNSNIWYTGRPASGYTSNDYATFRGTGTGGMGNRIATVYVGANDGMLHAFNASTGAEVLAYIPQGIAEGNLRKLTDIGYTHQYYVDGAPFTGDAYLSDGSTSAWKTMLVGSLGAGGKGYFVLDVTNPANFTSANAANIVKIDTTATTDPDIGYISSLPVIDDAVANKSRQIVKLNNGRWATVMGNGVNSTNEAPVLLIQYLDGDKALKKLSPCAFPTSGTCSFKGSNGLAAPQLIDLTGDGMVDIAYAGDNQGNLWKFNLTSASDSSWGMSFNGQPFFVAKRSGTPQPISTAPFWMPHAKGGVMVAFGTGRNLTDTDQTDTGTQSLYSVWDSSSFSVTSGVVSMTDTSAINTVTSPVLTSLVQQTYTATPVEESGVNYYNSSNNTVDFNTKKGWYLDWPIERQRVLTNIRAFTGEKILIQTTIPKSGSSTDTETCAPSATAERSFQSVLNMFTGMPPSTPFFNFYDHTISSARITMVESGAGDTTLIRTDSKLKLLSSNCPVGTNCTAKDFIPGDAVGVRASWRQILK